MLKHPLKIIPLLVSIFIHSTVFGADGDKDDSQLTRVTVSRASSGEVSTWGDKIGILLPDTSQKYHLTMDLSDLGTLALCNLNKFFVQLSLKAPVISQITQLTLTNGTSFRFNKIKDGLITLVKQNPQMEIEYFHKGIQAPRSPTKTLKTMAHVRGCALQIPYAGYYILKPVESDGEQIETVINGNLTPRIQSYEKETKLESLKAQFSGIENRNGFASWPPFGIQNKKQVVEIYCDDLASFNFSTDMTPVFIILSGMSGYNMEDLYTVCKSHSSIRAVKFINSALQPKDLEILLPLIGKQLVMLDVSGAFGRIEDKNIWPKLTEFLTSHDKGSLVEYFTLKDLSQDLEPHQKIKAIMSEYVTTITSNGADH